MRKRIPVPPRNHCNSVCYECGKPVWDEKLCQDCKLQRERRKQVWGFR